MLTYIPTLDTALDLSTVRGVNVAPVIDDYEALAYAMQVVHANGDVRYLKSFRTKEEADQAAKEVIELTNEKPAYE